jgi:Bacterial mobilisation protein (MobC)
MWPVGASQFLKARVSPDLKHQVQRAAQEQLITESVWLRRLVAAEVSSSVRSVGTKAQEVVKREAGEIKDARVYVRLRPGDRLLLHERAAARGMRAATYLSVLARSHLRNLPPLPEHELLALKTSVAELGAIGRNLNQLARALNRGERVGAPGRQDLYAMLKVCSALRDHVKALLTANLNSWSQGHAQATH